MLRVRDDDAGAFEELVRRYQSRLVRLMQTLAPHTDLAEDLAQETFLRVYRARERYEPGAKFSTWLFTIAGNVARNAKRTASRRHEISEMDAPRFLGASDDSGPLLATTALDASGMMPVRLAEGDERARLVRAAVASLSERQRMALILSRFENMNYVEIAETMGLTTKAVKSLLSRARVGLKESLDSYMQSGVLDEDLHVSQSLPSTSKMLEQFQEPHRSARSKPDNNGKSTGDPSGGDA
ncbi:ECF RNA polymerase sigma-E factor [Allorhodopirellula heiligendammensis]|uniref:RNA polymerase sigma factor n=2 Tax=Allorhodopirellula heiligendammensis TaxID=2714739 RepID=A0A5C6C6U5_9BACT|nr:ECF RNA polymerase sigma-E factor [Allorhodopirellula heiligendammensis]|tara:strand:- start:263 stop:982 length:720 start_codon:yes stop_codon:yes gene_type:complete